MGGQTIAVLGITRFLISSYVNYSYAMSALNELYFEGFSKPGAGDDLSRPSQFDGNQQRANFMQDAMKSSIDNRKSLSIGYCTYLYFQILKLCCCCCLRRVEAGA